MDFNLNDEQELFVAGIRELMASENWEAYFAECDYREVNYLILVKNPGGKWIKRDLMG